MTPFEAYKNEFTGKAYQTKAGCLKSEFHHLKQDVLVCLGSLMLLPSVSLDVQFKRLLSKIRRLYDKGMEYHAVVKPVPMRDGVPLYEDAAVDLDVYVPALLELIDIHREALRHLEDVRRQVMGNDAGTHEGACVGTLTTT